MTAAALDGILVVDLAGTVATSYCAKLFADHGADVVNLESAGGFPTRQLPPFLPGAQAPESSAMHAYLHTGKKSVVSGALAPSTEHALIARANLVLDDGADDARANPSTGVRSSIAWFGRGGPYERFTGSDALCFALNGMLRSIGPPEGPPLIPTGYQAQIVGGLTAFIASMAHVLAGELGHRDAPVHVETSIFESMLCFTDVGAVSALNTGVQAPRLGINRYAPTYPLGVFPCRDGWLGVTVLTPGQWRAFCMLLDMPEFADVDLFQTSIGRLQAIDVIEPVFRAKLVERGVVELFERGQAARIPLARVPTMEELFGIEQFRSRGAFCTAPLPDGRTLAMPSVPFRLLATPAAVGGPVAAFGAHSGMFA